jgi:GWxTD domain-containing protein
VTGSSPDACAAVSRSGRAGAALLALALALACAESRPLGVSDLTNPRLGPEYSQWLVGAAARLATPQEIDEYLGLREDSAGKAFIERFWERRDPDPGKAGNPAHEAFLARAAVADQRFSEAGYLGRRTDRGTIFILYGEPDDARFAVGEFVGEPAIEMWQYRPEGRLGLDGKRPHAVYRFAKTGGDLTTFYHPRQRRIRGMDPGVP